MINDVRFKREKIHEQLPIDQIEPLKKQPRTHFDSTDLGELAASLKAMGQADDIRVIRLSSEPPKFRLVDGERRYRSAKKAGLETVKAIEGTVIAEGKARTLPLERQLYIVASGLNIPKAVYLPIEFARMIEQVGTDLELSDEELAVRYNVHHQTIINHKILLGLPRQVQNMMEGKIPQENRLKLSLAILLKGYAETFQVKMAIKAVEGHWTARQLAFEIREATAEKKLEREGRKRKIGDDRRLLDSVLERIEERLHIAQGIPEQNIEALVRQGGAQVKRMYIACIGDVITALGDLQAFIEKIDIRKTI